MKVDKLLLAATLSTLLLSSYPVGAAEAANNGRLPVPASRIVGLWVTQGATSPCGTTLPPSVNRNTLLFHAGGTVVENSRFSPAGVANASGVPGVNQRTEALGTWSYDRGTGDYSLFLRFDWYVDGAYHGYQTVERTITLSSDGLQGTGEVRSTRYSAAGATVVAVCGTAISDRL